MSEYADLEDLGILIVDEKQENQQVYRDILESKGARLFFATSGDEALTFMLTRLKEEGVKVIVAQEQLEQMRAKDLVAVSQITTSLKDIRFIVVFSGENDTNEEVARAQGFSGFVNSIQEEELFIGAVLGTMDDHEDHSEQGNGVYEGEQKKLSSLNILLVEDNAINQKVALKTLYKRGYRCDTAWNGKEAVEAVMSKDYDVILMDCQMPVMDGYEAARQIRKYEKGDRYVRIVALTAYALEGDREKCFDAGMDLYLTKPIDFDKVQEVLVAIEGVELPPTPVKVVESETKVVLGTIADYEEHFIERTGFDKSEVVSLFEEFEALYTQQMATMTKALEEEDYVVMKDLAHQIKGSAGNLLIEPMQLEAKNLEKNIAEKNLIGCRENIVRLRAYIERG